MNRLSTTTAWRRTHGPTLNSRRPPPPRFGRDRRSYHECCRRSYRRPQHCRTKPITSPMSRWSAIRALLFRRFCVTIVFGLSARIVRSRLNAERRIERVTSFPGGPTTTIDGGNPGPFWFTRLPDNVPKTLKTSVRAMLAPSEVRNVRLRKVSSSGRPRDPPERFRPHTQAPAGRIVGLPLSAKGEQQARQSSRTDQPARTDILTQVHDIGFRDGVLAA